MTSEVTLVELGSLSDLNLSVSSSEAFQFESELDILFQPENVLIALYVPLILVSLVTNVLLIVVAVKCHYTKK